MRTHRRSVGIWRSIWRTAALGLALALLGSLSACVATPAASTGATPTATSSAPTSTATTSATTPTPGAYPVKVYFSKHPDSDNDPTKVFSVRRVSPTLGVATFAIKQLLAGPDPTEKSAGYYTPWEGALTGASNCGGADFVITLDHRGSTPAPGVATLQFCRTTQIPGELAGARMTATAQQTLLQFSNIKSVVILNVAGQCFDDLSGQNACLAG